MKLFKKLNTKGFGHIEALLVVLAIVIIGGAYLLVHNGHALSCLGKTASGQCISYSEYVDYPPSLTMTSLNKVYFGAKTNSIPFSLKACFANGMLTATWTVNKVAGKNTIQYSGGWMLVHNTSPDGHAIQYSTKMVSNRGYNPIAVLEAGPTQSILPLDYWSPLSPNFSFQSKTVSITATGTFRVGIRGILNGSAQTVWSKTNSGSQWYSVSTLAACTV